jgi:hypothetical protein
MALRASPYNDAASGPLFAAEQSQPRWGVVGEHWASLVYACLTNKNSRLMHVQSRRRRASCAAAPTWRAAQGHHTSLRGSGGEPGRPFSLVTFFYGRAKRKSPAAGPPPAMPSAAEGKSGSDVLPLSGVNVSRLAPESGRRANQITNALLLSNLFSPVLSCGRVAL